MSLSNFALCTSKKWNEDLIDSLEEKLKIKFILINNKENFTINFLQINNIHKIFIVHWSDIIPTEIYQNIECIIFHMTDLPFGRGGSPLQNLIINGIAETKISALKCVKELDAGPIYLKHNLSLEGSAFKIFERAKKVIFEMIVEIVQKNPTPIDQNGEITLFKRRKPEESSLTSFLDSHPKDIAPSKIYDFIRMLDADGYPHAFFETTHFKFELRNAKIGTTEVYADVRIIKKE